MKQSLLTRCLALAAVALTVAGCTMKEQDQPSLSGPSEFGQSLTPSVSPDVLTQDGASQSIVTVIARGPDGNPLPNLSLRAEILVGGVTADFGRLSARSIVTNSNGRATLVYTAPAVPNGVVVDEFTLVNIAVTPVGTDYGNAATRTTTVRLVPPSGVIVAPPAGLQPRFTFTPAAPTDNQNVLFDGSTSQSPANNPIAQFVWDFGDGDSATGMTATHSFRVPGTFVVTLSVIDAYGRAASTSQSVTVVAGANPVALFSHSPTSVKYPNTDVFFNASGSTASPGRRIVRYEWVWGDGTTSEGGPTITKRYGTAGTFVVSLTVTDDAGRFNTASGEIIITPRP